MLPLEVEQYLAEFARLLEASEGIPYGGGGEDAVDERHDAPGLQVRNDLTGEGSDGDRLSSGALARRPVPISRARRPMSFRRSSGASVPPPVPTITILPLI